MFDFSYERFLADGYPACKPSLEFPETSKCSLEVGMNRAKRFLEASCSPAYGYTEEAYDTKDMSQPIVSLIPTSFATGFCLGLLKGVDIHPSVVQTLVTVITESRRPSGLWNFFLTLPDKCSELLPDDIDDTGCFCVALYQLKRMTLEECQSVANYMLENMQVGPNGGMGTWITSEDANAHSPILIKRLLTYPREDVGCMLNALWFLATIGMDTDERVISSIHCVNKFLDEHLNDVDKVLKHFMFYYTERYVLYYFIARFMVKSKYALDLFGEKVAKLVMQSLLKMGTHGTQALQMAGCIMAAMTLQLHKNDGLNLLSLTEENVTEIRTKIMELTKDMLAHQHNDGYFPVWKLYRWNHLGHYGGSKVISTSFVLAAMNLVKTEIMEEGHALKIDLQNIC